MAQERGMGFTAEELRELRQAFADEAREHLEALDAALAGLETSLGQSRPSGTAAGAGGLASGAVDAGRARAMATLLRELHTFKGAAGSVELDELAHQAHALEDRVVALSATGSAMLDAGELDGLR